MQTGKPQISQQILVRTFNVLAYERHGKLVCMFRCSLNLAVSQKFKQSGIATGEYSDQPVNRICLIRNITFPKIFGFWPDCADGHVNLDLIGVLFYRGLELNWYSYSQIFEISNAYWHMSCSSNVLLLVIILKAQSFWTISISFIFYW